MNRFENRLLLFIALVAALGATAWIFIPPSQSAIAQRTATMTWPRGFVLEDDGNEVFACTGACASAGEAIVDADGNAQNPTAGTYFVTVGVETVFLCPDGAAACASPDGIELPAGFAGYLYLNGGTAFARSGSAGGAGTIRLHKATAGN